MLEGRHFQNAYLCDDLEKGIELFRQRGLTREPMIIPVDQQIQTPDGLKRQKGRICFVWVGDMQYELIESEIDEAGIYANCAPGEGYFRFHHVCFRVDDWDAFRSRLDSLGYPLAMERPPTDDPHALKFLYLDARSVLGHYIEYTWMPDAMWDRLKSM